ncbi:NnrU family protein [Litoreibacter roseus]|uniref:Membrane protein n=1 Tax=Litoreibacter roseus TaxID=2601869 RepID=A0A6N6JCY1_9RHOB|nr:NnrU family protein [Litoreibacter roseus]GFE63279.1 membrane protein [Litoreibacter roseus]
MGWVLLVAGLVLWCGAHLFKRIAPELRTRAGDPGKGAITVLILLSVVLMWIGYRRAGIVDLWFPPPWTVHINNLLMLVAVFLIDLGFSRGVLRTKLRHPMLTAIKIWAVAHLLVNGDLASVILFGGMLAWAVVTVILINKQDRAWTPPERGPVRNDIIYGSVALVIFAVIIYIHNWLGVWPLPG